MANLKSILKANAVEKAPAAKKNSMPVIQVTNEMAEKVIAYQEAKAQFKMAEAVMKMAEGEIIELVRERQDADGFAGRYNGSYNVVGEANGVSGQVKVIFQDKYSALNGEDEPQLKEILGNHFDELIDEKFDVALKPEVLENEALSDELTNLVGDRFGEFFNIVVSMKIKPGFKSNVYRAVNSQGLSNLRTYVKQYKPSMK